ncbi:PEX14 / peroxin 14 [Leishmania donovani]|uniref:Peroxisomal membrane protein PEX14 n=1 Tax=Leishmania donovani TaxID=5661 RepID=Q8MX25_LEIDO|nr:peroxin 14 [Leishmania donovani]TPP54581.1 Peroxisomal membrane anchor protein (Pex14p) conserved region family protein [Leishmania donovani]CAJ1988691.1 PEX14 / peroxin 14 [Leishmania donovani]VDZ44571.1 peroxin_14_putative/GeneDB:LmjF.21.1840 [Leishmania donovani]
MAAEVPAQPQAALEAPLPEPEQPSSSELDADPTVQSAIRFLQDSRVRRSPVESQIRFLKGKGVPDEQIKYALAKVGRAVTAEKIASVRAPPANAAPTGATATACTTPLSAQLKTARQNAPVTMTPGPQYTQTLFPHSPPPPQVERQTKTVDWRDVVIGAGAAMLSGFSAYKLFNRYSPYEFRRKTDKKSRLYRGSSSRPRSANIASSGSETDASSTPQRGCVPPLPPPPPMAAAAEPSVSAASPAALTEEVKRLQTELDEAKEALANERKKCADLAVSAAKIRADKQQLSRANDRLTQQIDGLKKDIEKLEREKSSAVGEATQTTAEGAVAAAPGPPSTYFPSVTTEGEQARNSPEVTSVTSASAPNSDVVPVLPVVPSPEAPATATAAPAMPDPITEAVQVAPASAAAVAPAPELPPVVVAASTPYADAAAPVATVTEVAAPLLPIGGAEPPKAGDGTPMSIG